MKAKCETCTFYKPFRDDGLCVKNAPIVSAKGKWPTVRPEDWCGEYKISEVAQNKRLCMCGHNFFAHSIGKCSGSRWCECNGFKEDLR